MFEQLVGFFFFIITLLVMAITGQGISNTQAYESNKIISYLQVKGIISNDFFEVASQGANVVRRPESYLSYQVNDIFLDTAKSIGSTSPKLQDQMAHARLWQEFSSLIPTSVREVITEFLVYDTPEDKTAVYVTPAKKDLSEWVLAMNLDYTTARNGELILFQNFYETLIHEFFHILTLHSSQVNSLTPSQICFRFYTGEGCARKESIIDAFYQQFWSSEMLDLVDSHPDAYLELYAEDNNAFVSQYAASNPSEDLAESFVEYVKQGRPVNCTQNTKTEKICFFYEYPQLQVIRNKLKLALKNKGF